MLNLSRKLSVLGMLTAIIFASGATAQAECSLAQDRPSEVFVKNVASINTQAFVDQIQNTIGDEIMGYVVVLRGQNGRRIAEINYGYARTPCEPEGERVFDGETVIGWASVGKMVTTAAVLNKIDRFQSKSLDDAMIDYLPEQWETENCSGQRNRCWRDVRIRHLLSYRGGFRSVDDTFQNRIAASTTERRVGNRAYNNSHFSIWHFMGSFFAEGKMREWEAGFRPGEITYDDYIFARTRTIWKDYLTKHIFSPLDIRGSCADLSIGGDNFAKLYANPNSVRGYMQNDRDTANCASGGITMSPRDMSKFIYALTRTNKIVSRELYEETLGRTDSAVTGWNGSIEVDDGRVFRKAGGAGAKLPSKLLDNNYPGRVGSQAMSFPNGMTAVIVINSRRDSEANWSLRSVLLDAYSIGLAERPRRTNG